MAVINQDMEPQNTPNTQMAAHEDRADVLSKRIIGCALTVRHALRKAGLAVSRQHRMGVRYDGIAVGDYAVDLFV